MKPANHLLFKDYRIKLGDLGVSIKIPDNATASTQIYLKGITPVYSQEYMEIKYQKEAAVTVKELYENDYYSLWMTFQKNL